MEPNEAISIGKSKESVNLRRAWPILMAPMNLQSFMLILHFNHRLINNLITCEFELSFEWEKFHGFHEFLFNRESFRVNYYISLQVFYHKCLPINGYFVS